MYKKIKILQFFQEEDIRLYSCLANGSADEFNKGEFHFKSKCVKDPLQIGELNFLCFRKCCGIFLANFIFILMTCHSLSAKLDGDLFSRHFPSEFLTPFSPFRFSIYLGLMEYFFILNFFGYFRQFKSFFSDFPPSISAKYECPRILFTLFSTSAGFHLSATITGKQTHNTSVTFDRKKIVSCQCTCNSQAEWCSHVVALCLHRIHQCHNVRLRAPVSESLSRLERDQLRKFAQYLIAKLPEQILPVAQNILDDLLSTAQTGETIFDELIND